MMSSCGEKSLPFLCLISHRSSLQMTQFLSWFESFRVKADILEDWSLSLLNSPEASRKILTSVSHHNLQKINSQISIQPSGACQPHARSKCLARACSAAPVPKVPLHLILTTAHRSSHYYSPHLSGKETQTYGFLSQLWIQTVCFPSKSRLLATKP